MQLAASANGDSSTPFGSLLLAVFNSILEVVLICSAGYILASKGILDKKTQKQLNRLNVSLFTPALLFSKVAIYLTPEKLKQLYVIPIWFFIVTVVSMGVGSILGWLFGLRSSQRSFIMAAAMFMNSNALPIALMQSLVVAVPDLKWGNDDDKNIMLGRALTYLTMYSTLGMVVRYSYGIRLLARADTIAIRAHAPSLVADERTPLLVDTERAATLSTRPSTSTMVDQADNEFLVSSPKNFGASDLQQNLLTDSSSGRRIAPRRGTTFYRSFPNSPNDSCPNLGCYAESSRSSYSSESGDGVPPLSLNSQGDLRRERHRHSPRHRFVRAVRYYWAAINNFMTVPLWAALVSLLVACIQPLQHALTQHLHPVNDAINNAGKCSVPLTLVVLGAYFYPEPTKPEEQDPFADTNDIGDIPEPKKTVWQKIKGAFSISTYRKNATPSNLRRKDAPNPGETKTVFLAVAARMIVTPILIMPLVVIATKYDLHKVFEDPVFVVCNIILLASPPALTLAQITQAVSGDAFERLISRTIFWSYCVCTPPVTIIYVVVGLFLAKL